MTRERGAALRGALRCTDTGMTIATDARLATGIPALLFGLIGRAALPDGAALGLVGCDQVHTFGVRFPIDVVYCDRCGRVLRVVPDVDSNRIAPRAPGAAIAWEIPAGTAVGRVRPGDHLVWEKSPEESGTEVAAEVSI